MGYLQRNIYWGDNLEVFDVEKVSYTYRNGRKAVDEVSFRVKEGESLTIIGTNGSGKSTLLYLLNGLTEPESGNIKTYGRDSGNGFSSELRQKISLLFQNPHAQLFLLSVWDELCFGPLHLKLDKDEIQKRAWDILKLLGIEHLKDRGPWDLSGGEMKKVALGTCLSVNPDVLLLDEPTTGLDPRSQVEVVDLINELRTTGKTIITATHDLGIIEDISDRTIVLGEDHRVLHEGKPWDVIENTDALLHANLIHKHLHRHAWYVHEHSHFGSHEHEHPPEISYVQESARGKVAAKMTDIDKLRKLLGHWLGHNRSHRETYEEWAEKMESLPRNDLALLLKEIAKETEKIDSLFLRLRELL